MQPSMVLPSSKGLFQLPSGAFALREDGFHMIAYPKFCSEHPSHGSLALSTLQQDKHFNYCIPTYVYDVIHSHICPQSLAIQILIRSFTGCHSTPNGYASWTILLVVSSRWCIVYFNLCCACLLLPVLCVCMCVCFVSLCDLRLFYVQSHCDDSHVHTTSPHPACAATQAHPTMSCIHL